VCVCVCAICVRMCVCASVCVCALAETHKSKPHDNYSVVTSMLLWVVRLVVNVPRETTMPMS